MRILLVDDDRVSLGILEGALARLGHSVDTAPNGKVALELLESDQFDVVISDWIMPEVNGLEICRELRKRGVSDYVYFIMHSIKNDRASRLEALDAGADDFLSKPLDPTELAARLVVAERIVTMHIELRDKGELLRSTASFAEIARRRFSELFMRLPIPCLTIDHKGVIMEWNRVAEELYNMKAHEVWMKPIWDVIVARKYRKEARELAWAALGTSGVSGTEALDWHYPLKDGRRKHMMVSTFAFKDAANNVTGAAIAFVDITVMKDLEAQITEQLTYANELSASLEMKNLELEDLSKRLAILATIDGLTGLYNRRTFMEHAESQRDAFSKGEISHLSFIITDVDKFKSFNDEFGHQVGDEVLRGVARIFKDIVDQTPGAYVARYGGEEFVIALSDFDQQQALDFAEVLRKGIESGEWPWRQVTASFGISTCIEPGTKIDHLIEQADEALYYSKQNGRNQSSHFFDLKQKAA